MNRELYNQLSLEFEKIKALIKAIQPSEQDEQTITMLIILEEHAERLAKIIDNLGGVE